LEIINKKNHPVVAGIAVILLGLGLGIDPLQDIGLETIYIGFCMVIGKEIGDAGKSDSSSVHEKQTISPLEDTSPRIDFSPMIIQASKHPSYKGQQNLDRYKNYPDETVARYKARKKYPSGIDIRPPTFNPNGKNVCAHGTNLESVLKAIQGTNMQLVPGIKQVKLLGSLPQTGESSGTTPLNRKYVSAVDLSMYTSCYSMAIGYAENASSNFNKSNKPESYIPVVVIGDGVIRQDVYGCDVRHETAYKRVNIRILAFKDDGDKAFAANQLRELQKSNWEIRWEIRNIRLCTFAQLKETTTKPQIFFTHTIPDVSALWSRAVPISSV
jgi:hypothetical protein